MVSIEQAKPRDGEAVIADLRYMGKIVEEVSCVVKIEQTEVRDQLGRVDNSYTPSTIYLGVHDFWSGTGASPIVAWRAAPVDPRPVAGEQQ
jgi:hypothetical protein